MFDKVLKFFATLAPSPNTEASGFSPNDSRVAAAALMHHVIEADGILRDVEKERYKELLEHENNLAGKELSALLEAAQKADAEAVDLYKFTSVLVRELSQAQRVHFIELLWELVYADGVRHELEDNVVWRICELMGVSTQDRVAMRQRVEAQLKS
ncbi:MAG: TerB family tellurite resistance protein [Ahrensia sp.]|nr:TerB family tellurite resistance protein [Ahrensia sp.]